MKSLKRMGLARAAIPLMADDILELHAARLLLLISICGISGRIDGLTKMAKLDFFARYPDFFEIALRKLTTNEDVVGLFGSREIESVMVRHHYGPWDKRYYHVLAFLEANELVAVSKKGASYHLMLTDEGRRRASLLAERPSFSVLVARMRQIKNALGNRSGTALKQMIYQLFEDQVGSRRLGELIW